MKIPINAATLNALAAHSRNAGTQDKMIEMAVEWADKAEQHIAELTRRLSASEQENADLREMLLAKEAERGIYMVPMFVTTEELDAALAAKAAERAQPERGGGA